MGLSFSARLKNSMKQLPTLICWRRSSSCAFGT
jgi:hypothetical protein